MFGYNQKANLRASTIKMRVYLKAQNIASAATRSNSEIWFIVGKYILLDYPCFNSSFNFSFPQASIFLILHDSFSLDLHFFLIKILDL
jgi:hypothetical protein